MAYRVQYLGQKDVQVDRIFKTGTVWNGRGDVQLVKNEKIALGMAELGTYRLLEDNDSGELPPEIDPKDQPGKAEGRLSGYTVPEPILGGRPVPVEEASLNALETHARNIGLAFTEGDRERLLHSVILIMDAHAGRYHPPKLKDFMEEADTERELLRFMMKQSMKKKPDVSELKEARPEGVDVNAINATVRDAAWKRFQAQIRTETEKPEMPETEGIQASF